MALDFAEIGRISQPARAMEDVAEKTMTVPKQTSAVVQMITSQLRPGDER